MISPVKFVRPADLFKQRRKSKIQEPQQSPMKCLNNLTDPSPTKKLPTLLRNPFNQPVKRRLQLGSPNKLNRLSSSPSKQRLSHENFYHATSSASSSPLKITSPTKAKIASSPLMKAPQISEQIDEDANLEPPKMKRTRLDSPLKQNKTNTRRGCCDDDWKLRTKLRINFRNKCKNWSQYSSTTHKRNEDSPGKTSDKTISVEAIKNAGTVYQHPYFSWMPLYPRINDALVGTKKPRMFESVKHEKAIESMYKDWCESLSDLSNLLIDGRCPFFYLCADKYTVLFQHNRHEVQAFVSPLNHGMCLEMKKAYNVDIVCDDDRGIENNSSSFSNGTKTQYDEELEVSDDEDLDGGSVLNELGIQPTAKDFPLQSFCSRGPTEIDASNSQSTKSLSTVSLATIKGAKNVRRFVRFLKSSKKYTINTIGEYAHIPPTLLSPGEFRLSTPNCPTVKMSRDMAEISELPFTPNKHSSNNSCLSDNSNSVSHAQPITGPTFVELEGIILPHLHKKLHKLLAVSENLDHSCSSTHLLSSDHFGSIH